MAYYFHWSREEIIYLPHRERIKFCEEASKINKKLNDESSGRGPSIFDVK